MELLYRPFRSSSSAIGQQCFLDLLLYNCCFLQLYVITTHIVYPMSSSSLLSQIIICVINVKNLNVFDYSF